MRSSTDLQYLSGSSKEQEQELSTSEVEHQKGAELGGAGGSGLQKNQGVGAKNGRA